MAYVERKYEQRPRLVTVELTCDARKGGRGPVCGNYAAVTMSRKDDALQYLLDLGWRFLRGHVVCSGCIKRGGKNVHFPRKQDGVSE
jgi:hypothetical protein